MISGAQRITSPQNPRIQAVVKLRQRSHREDAGLLIIEGHRELARALANRWIPSALFVCEELFPSGGEPPAIADCRAAGAELFACTPAVFARLAYRERPDGLLAVAPQQHRTLADLRLPADPLLVVAETLEKPGNLGTILRSADAAGVHAVLLCDGKTDLYNPNVVRASLGTLFTVPVVEVSTPEALAWLRAHTIRILAASPHAERDCFEADLRGGLAITVGAEQDGLSRAWLDQADLTVRIPMFGQADSLNVAAATTILLYEAVRQRRRS